MGIYDPANEHAEHSLARVSLVDLEGTVVLDTFVAQREKIGDWRTAVSGVRPGDVQNGTRVQTACDVSLTLIDSTDVCRSAEASGRSSQRPHPRWTCSAQRFEGM